MEFCDDCGSTMVQIEGEWICRDCDPDSIPESTGADDRTPPPRSARLADLPTTDSGSVRKAEAMEWLDSLSQPSGTELRNAVVPKPAEFSGSTFPTSISNVRVTGDPKFVETVAGLLKPLQDLEGGHTRLEINLKRTEDRETGTVTGNYALYLSAAERG